MKTKVVNLFGGPGTGKSTTAAGLFAELKLRGVNCELVSEYAKDKAWELGSTSIGTPMVFQAQEYIFAKQHFRFRRCARDVDLIITDSPLLLGLIYKPATFDLPSLGLVIREAHTLYDSLNIFLVRTKDYNPKGRLQTEEKARALDIDIREMLQEELKGNFSTVEAGRPAIEQVLLELEHLKWINPA